MDEAAKQLEHKQRLMQQTFLSPVGQEVLGWLAEFCRANKSTFDVDARVSALKQGRQEVFLWIMEYLKLSIDDLYSLKTGGRKLEINLNAE